MVFGKHKLGQRVQRNRLRHREVERWVTPEHSPAQARDLSAELLGEGTPERGTGREIHQTHRGSLPFPKDKDSPGEALTPQDTQVASPSPQWPLRGCCVLFKSKSERQLTQDRAR